MHPTWKPTGWRASPRGGGVRTAMSWSNFTVRVHFSGLKGPSSKPGGAIGPMTVSPPDVCATDQLNVPQDSSSSFPLCYWGAALKGRKQHICRSLPGAPRTKPRWPPDWPWRIFVAWSQQLKTCFLGITCLASKIRPIRGRVAEVSGGRGHLMWEGRVHRGILSSSWGVPGPLVTRGKFAP